MKIIYNRYIPFPEFSAINLFGYIFARKECKPLDQVSVNHELIHTAQIREMLFVFFYLFYVLEWLVRWMKTKNRMEAYFQLSFEKEAHENMDNPGYLKNRKAYAWVKYF